MKVFDACDEKNKETITSLLDNQKEKIMGVLSFFPCQLNNDIYNSIREEWKKASDSIIELYKKLKKELYKRGIL